MDTFRYIVSVVGFLAVCIFPWVMTFSQVIDSKKDDNTAWIKSPLTYEEQEAIVKGWEANPDYGTANIDAAMARHNYAVAEHDKEQKKLDDMAAIGIKPKPIKLVNATEMTP